MLMLIADGLPLHCPQCGAKLHPRDWQASPDDRAYGLSPTTDLHAGASHTCPALCGLMYQHVTREALLAAAAAAGGDLARYA